MRHYSLDQNHPRCHALILKIIRQGVSEYLGMHTNLPVLTLDNPDNEDETLVELNIFLVEMPADLREFAEDVLGNLNIKELKNKYQERYYYLREDLELWLGEM
jgi:hypothetical protein